MKSLTIEMIFIYIFCIFPNSFSMNFERNIKETDEVLIRIEKKLEEIAVLGNDISYELDRQGETLNRTVNYLDDTSNLLDKSSLTSYSFRRIMRWIGVGIGSAVGLYFGTIEIPIGACIFGLAGDQFGEKLNKIFDEIDDKTLEEFKEHYPRIWNLILHFIRKEQEL